MAALSLSAQGKLEVNGQSFSLTHVYACLCPDQFDSKKTLLTIRAVDREVAPAIRTDGEAMRELFWDGKLNGVEITIEGNSAAWRLKTKAVGNASVFGNRSPNPFALTVTATNVKGSAKLAETAENAGANYRFEFAVDAVIEKPIVEPPPTAADRAAAAQNPAAQAYLAFQKVLMTGTVAQIADLVDPQKGEMMRQEPNAKEALAFIRKMQPKQIAVLKATGAGDDVQLITSGMDGAKPQSGKVAMKKINGKWIVMKEAWQNAR